MKFVIVKNKKEITDGLNFYIYSSSVICVKPLLIAANDIGQARLLGMSFLPESSRGNFTACYKAVEDTEYKIDIFLYKNLSKLKIHIKRPDVIAEWHEKSNQWFTV